MCKEKTDCDGVEDSKADLLTYHVNLFLFLVFTVSSMIWFHRHLHLYVTHSLIIGGSLTTWGVLKVVQAVLKWGTGKTAKPGAASVLGRNGSTECLIVGLIVLAILFATTSSIYLVYEDIPKGGSEFDVEVLHNGKPYLEKVKLRSFDRVSGRPFFFRLSSIDLDFRITNPMGYLDKKVGFSAWSSVRLRVPGSFEPKKLRIVRLIPGERVYALLPSPGDAVERPYEVHITIEGEESKIKIPELLQQMVYIGARKDEIEWMIAREKVETRRRILDKYLISLGFESDRRREVFDTLELNRRIKDTPDLEAGKQMQVDVMPAGSDMPCASVKFSIASDAGIQTVFLEAR